MENPRILPTAAPACRSSVVVVSYNNREDLQAGFPSLLASLGPQDEIILVDNASPDGSAATVQRDYPSVRVLASKTNLGFGAACNLGAQSARGEYLAFLNPDTRVDPGWLETLIGSLQNDPAVGMATSKIVLWDSPQTVNTCGNDVHLSGLTLCRGMGRPAGDYTRGEDVAAVSGAAFAMRRELFLELGGFDEDFFLYMEDTDLSLRARLAGWRIAFVPDSQVKHAYRLRFGPDKIFYQERNRYLMLLKLFTWRTLFVLIPMWLLGEGVSWGFVLFRDIRRFGNKFRAYAWTVGHLATILKKRKAVQSTRKVRDRDLLALANPQVDFEQLDMAHSLTFIFRIINALSAFFARLTLRLV